MIFSRSEQATSGAPSIPIALRAALLASFIALFSCSPAKGPESIVKTFVATVEYAAEAGNLRTIRGLISEHYRDRQNRSKQDIVAVAAGYLLGNRSIFILSRLQTAQREDRTITATVLAALAARPIDDPSLLPDMNADIYFFDIELAEEEGEWKLTGASWRQALVEDFLSD